jgi:hypothetical protein
MSSSSGALLSALLESAREPLGPSHAMTAAVLLCTVATALLLAFECGQYPCGKFYLRPRRAPVWG